ncbi:MAG: extracellular solute-binding protein [Anaerolineae bacterium]|nr:extracellular solute-binding protein [Anaerolineae bacterium]
MFRYFTYAIIFLALLFTACQPLESIVEPPRVATLTALAEAEPFSAGTPVVLPAPTPTPGAVSAEPTPESVQPATLPLTFWVDDTAPETAELVRMLTDRFTAQSGVPVETIFVDPDRLPGLIGTAQLTNTLPDVVLHSLEQTAKWRADGILDTVAASEVVEQLGMITFEQGVLDVLRGSDGRIAAIPTDARQHLIVYRSDWFEQAGLAPPTSFAAMLLGAATFFEEEGLTSGIVVPTESKLASTQRIFEHFAIANGCRLVDAQGEIISIHPACLEALDFYRDLINQYSPIGFQTDISAVKAYLAGRTAMIMAMPEVLPLIVGLDPLSLPRCAECAADPTYLVENSGIATQLGGNLPYGTVAAYPDMTALGITTAAKTEAAQAFAVFWLSEAYGEWLSLFPESKIPLRPHSADTDNFYRDIWRTAPLRPGSGSLESVFGPELIAQLTSGFDQIERWGFKEGQSQVIGQVYPSLELSQMLQEMLSGYISSAQAVYELYNRSVNQIPNYGFALPTPTPEPDSAETSS